MTSTAMWEDWSCRVRLTVTDAAALAPARLRLEDLMHDVEACASRFVASSDLSRINRAAGRLVVQASHIVALHRESATRGSVMSSAEHARDQADWAWLRAQWGAALDVDPAYNPHWLRVGQPFDGLHAPSPDAVSRWIAASARPRPWSVTPPA